MHCKCIAKVLQMYCKGITTTNIMRRVVLTNGPSSIKTVHHQCQRCPCHTPSNVEFCYSSGSPGIFLYLADADVVCNRRQFSLYTIIKLKA